MLSIGLAARSDEIIAPIRHPVWVLRALIANFVLAPLLAWSMAYVVPLNPGYELGLLLLGFAAGSPLLPKLAEAGRTNVASATALMVLLMVGTVVIMPLALPLFAKGMQVNPWRIAAALHALMSFTETIAAGRAFTEPGEPRPDPNQGTRRHRRSPTCWEACSVPCPAAGARRRRR